MAWFEENVALLTFAAAAVAALAALWTARETQAMKALQRRTLERPDPVVIATVEPVKDAAGWSLLRVEIRNRADVPLRVVSVSFLRPHAVLLMREIEGQVTDGYGSMQLRLPISADPARPAAEVGMTLRQSGVRGSQHEWGEQGWARFLVHRSPPELLSARIRLEMRWMDHAAKRFALAATAISAKET